jgi:futalosine hydrolase
VILLVAAVPKELKWLQPSAEFDVLFTGVGPADAAARVAFALANTSYRAVVNAGIAGAMLGMAGVGDGVVVSEERMEIDCENGDRIVLPDGERIVDAVQSDPLLVDALRVAGFAALRGITVSRVTSTMETAKRLANLGAQVESMEGFAVLRAAQLAGVRAVEVRGISNLVGPREQSAWDFAAGIDGLERVVRKVLSVI